MQMPAERKLENEFRCNHKRSVAISYTLHDSRLHNTIDQSIAINSTRIGCTIAIRIIVVVAFRAFLWRHSGVTTIDHHIAVKLQRILYDSIVECVTNKYGWPLLTET